MVYKQALSTKTWNFIKTSKESYQNGEIEHVLRTLLGKSIHYDRNAILFLDRYVISIKSP